MLYKCGCVWCSLWVCLFKGGRCVFVVCCREFMLVSIPPPCLPMYLCGLLLLSVGLCVLQIQRQRQVAGRGRPCSSVALPPPPVPPPTVPFCLLSAAAAFSLPSPPPLRIRLHHSYYMPLTILIMNRSPFNFYDIRTKLKRNDRNEWYFGGSLTKFSVCVSFSLYSWNRSYMFKKCQADEVILWT